jgi:hypothetical protein
MAFVRRLGCTLPTFRSSLFAGRHFSTETNGSTPNDAPKSSETTEIPKQVEEVDGTEKSKKPRFGFKDSFLKFSNIFEEKPEQPPQPEQSFASLLRKSKFMEVVSYLKNSLIPSVKCVVFLDGRS